MLLLSIRPVYVKRIFAGTKTFELRKRKPNVDIGARVIIYSTTPDCEFVGYATISGFYVCSPSQLWRRVHSSCGVTKAEFDTYFADAELSVGISVENPTRFEKALSLSSIKKVWPGFHPPQQFQYLDELCFESVLGSLGCAAA